MGKLGKKARKFAKKHLQSVLRQRRKNKAIFNKRSRSSAANGEENSDEEQLNNPIQQSNGSIEDVEDATLDAVFCDDEDDVVADASDSDGYLSEDSSSLLAAESENEDILEGEGGTGTLSMQNTKLNENLVKQKKKLDKLKKKDPEFSKFLEKCDKGMKTSTDEETYSDEDERSNPGRRIVNESNVARNKSKDLMISVINSWSQLITEEQSHSALISMLNAYRTACHYGAESIDHRIQNSETFCNILMFVLSEADKILRGTLQIPSSKKEIILEMKNTTKWTSLRPLVKSYVRSTLFLLNQLTNSDILAFALTRLRASLIFFAAFPSLLHRLVKTTVHLWATGEGVLSSAAFLTICDVVTTYSSDFMTCFAKMFKAYNAQCRGSQIVVSAHMRFLKNSLVEFCSLDVQKASAKALASVSQLAKILQWALQTKKKEAMKKICSWEYVNCVDLWVGFVSANIRDYDLQPLLFKTIQLINGIAYLFPGARYFPLRLKCIQWLNNLSSSSGIFVPVASFVLDFLEYKIVKEGGKAQSAINFSSALKLPKHCIKSQTFLVECLFSAMEQLSAHFAQWSYHISFPELATIPLIRLRKFNETTSAESLKRVVKRLIDQVEQNVDFVQKKRDEVSFSPCDHQSVESFLQVEKSGNASFTQYYRSVLEKASLRSLHKNAKTSLGDSKRSKRKREELPNHVVETTLTKDSAKDKLPIGNGMVHLMKKKKKKRAAETQ